MNPRYVFAAVAAIALAGCSISTEPSGPVQHESSSIDLDKAELVKVNLKMGAGVLNVQGGAAKLMDADFTYNVPSWKPLVKYNNTGVRGELSVEQPSGSHTGGNTNYKWDLRLNDSVPIDLNVSCGATETKLTLGTLSLRSVEINIGVGELKVDLRGSPKRDYDVSVRGGVGEATVYLPPSVGIRAEASGGIGGLQVRGLHKEGSEYVNDAYAKSKVKIHLSVHGGVGSINLIAE